MPVARDGCSSFSTEVSPPLPPFRHVVSRSSRRWADMGIEYYTAGGGFSTPVRRVEDVSSAAVTLSVVDEREAANAVSLATAGHLRNNAWPGEGRLGEPETSSGRAVLLIVSRVHVIGRERSDQWSPLHGRCTADSAE